MFFRRRRQRREVPTLNTTSTADISFMLLIFFLVTTSMEQDKGLQRRLPPTNMDDTEQHFTDVDSKRVMTITITADNHILADDKALDDAKLAEEMGKFIERVGPEHIIEVHAAPDANYATYFHLQNIVARVYASLRNAYAVKKYDHTMEDCSDEELKAVKEKYPQRLSEDFGTAAQTAASPDDEGSIDEAFAKGGDA